MSDYLYQKFTMAPNESSKEDHKSSRAPRSSLRLPQRIADCDPEMKEKIREKVKTDIFVNPAPKTPHVFYNMSASSFTLPEDWGLQPQDFVHLLITALIDLNIQKYFMESKIINWNINCVELYPLRTTGDGNCLMHAISLFLWGIEDLDLQMRRILYKDIFEDTEVKQYRKRWRLGRAAFDQGIVEGFRYDTMNWDDEWKLVIHNASPEPNPDSQHMLPYHSLEEIHIFIIANILRRPIIVLADTMFRDTAGRSLQPQNVTGIYLPVLSKPEDCVPYPIVLGYHQNHFVPLVCKKMLPEENLDMILPLCTNKVYGFKAHFLLPNEDPQRLLRSYLRQKQLQHTLNSHTMFPIMAAELGTKEFSESTRIMKTYFTLAEKNYQASFRTGPAKTLTADPHKIQSGKSSIKICCMCDKNKADGDNDVCKECLMKNCTSFHPRASAPPESMPIGRVSNEFGNLKLEGSDLESAIRVPPQNPSYRSPNYAQNTVPPEYSICVDKPCRTPGCQFYCSSELKGDYCHTCSRKAPMVQRAKLEKCRTVGCRNEANPDRQGLCDTCSGTQHLKKQVSPQVVGYDTPSNILTASGFQSSYQTNMPYQGRSDILDDPSGLNSLVILQTNVGSKKCHEPTCRLTGIEAYQGFCSRCYEKNMKLHKHVEEKQSSNVKKYSLIQSNSMPRMPCKTENCDMFGTKEQRGYCTKCLNEILQKDSDPWQDVCRNHLCGKKVFQYGYCGDCFEHTPNLTESSHQSAHLQSAEQSGIVADTCITNGCQSLIVRIGDGRHCLKCHQAQASRQQASIQLGHVKCGNKNCDQETQNGQLLCIRCQNVLDTNNFDEQAFKANTVSPIPSSALNIPCKGCHVRLTSSGDICSECRHKEKLEEEEKFILNRKQGRQSPTYVTPNCKSQDCKMFGTPEMLGYCSKCFNTRQMKRESRSVPIKSSPSMLQEEGYQNKRCSSGCGQWANQQVLNGLCNDCYKLYKDDHPSRFVQSAKVNEPNVHRPEPRNKNRTDQSCFNPECSNRGNPKSKGFCNSCYAKLHHGK